MTRLDWDAPCTKCREQRPRSEFRQNGVSRRDGAPLRASYCKSCVSAIQAAPRHKKRRAEASVRRWYGMSLDEYDSIVAALLKAQGDVCAVCRRSANAGRRRATPSLDHDHETGAIRGVLCSDCNVALGFYRDDPERLEAAARYLLS